MIFAKAPTPGQVKTRLAGVIGEQPAAALYRRLVDHSLACASNASLGEIQLWVTPTVDDAFLGALAECYGCRQQLQQGADIGARMAYALEHALRDAAPALLIGSDCAVLTADYLRAAAVALQENHAVLGPTEDGGYFLIGLHQPCAALFSGIDWSTPQVAEQTRSRLRAARLRWKELPSTWDVDGPQDLQRLHATPGFQGWRNAAQAGAIIVSP